MKTPNCSLPYTVNDKELFLWIAKGDQAAFEALFVRYRGKIYQFILKAVKSEGLAEELTHDILLSIWTKQRKLVDIENPQAYLFTMVYNRIYSALRQLAAERAQKQGYSPADGENMTEDLLNAKATNSLINKAVEQLPPQRKKIYQLSREQGWSHEEIAREMNLSRFTVKNQLAEALKNIRHYLKKFNALFFFLLSDFFSHFF